MARSCAMSEEPVDIDGITTESGYMRRLTCSMARYISVSRREGGAAGRVTGYTYRVGSKHESRVFIEALAGGVRAYDSLFPTSRGVTNKASAFSWQVGGGWDIAITKHFAIRAFEADYVRSYVPNNGSNTQDHLRLAVGVTYHSQSQ